MSLKLKQQCIEKKKFGDYTINLLGNGKYSQVYKICKQRNCEALKEIKNTEFITRDSNGSEILFLYYCKQLNDAGITENLQNSLSFYNCPSCKTFYSLNDIESGDCWKFFETKRNVSEWKSLYFQLLAGIYTFQRYLDGIHFDLHPGNVLFSYKSPVKGTCKLYIINKKKYYLPCTGFTFKIADFGISYSKSLQIFNPDRMYNYKHYLKIKKGRYFDPRQIDTLVIAGSYYQNAIDLRGHPKVQEIEYFVDYWIYLAETGVKYSFQLIKELFQEYTVIPKNAKVVKTFNLDQNFLVKLK